MIVSKIFKVSEKYVNVLSGDRASKHCHEIHKVLNNIHTPVNPYLCCEMKLCFGGSTLPREHQRNDTQHCSFMIFHRYNTQLWNNVHHRSRFVFRYHINRRSSQPCRYTELSVGFDLSGVHGIDVTAVHRQRAADNSDLHSEWRTFKLLGVPVAADWNFFILLLFRGQFCISGTVLQYLPSPLSRSSSSILLRKVTFYSLGAGHF